MRLKMIPKFRVWDKNLKLIRNVSDIDFQNEEVGFYVDDYEGEDYIPEFEIARNFDEVELMQSTGLKDKNGVEIFEGDILKSVYIFDNEEVEEIGDVIFEDGCIKVNVPYETVNLIIDYVDEDVEIIGNIYENKDLLED